MTYGHILHSIGGAVCPFDLHEQTVNVSEHIDIQSNTKTATGNNDTCDRKIMMIIMNIIEMIIVGLNAESVEIALNQEVYILQVVPFLYPTAHCWVPVFYPRFQIVWAP